MYPETHSLRRRFLVLIGFVGALSLFDQLVIQHSLVHLATDAPLINVAGRQRMLSQRLAKDALAILRSENESERNRWTAELAGVLDEWTRAHEKLARGAIQGIGEAEPSSTAVKRGIEGLEPSFSRIRLAADGLRGGSTNDPRDAQRASRQVIAIMENEGTYLDRMNRLVGVFEEEAKARVAELRTLGWVISLLTIGCVGSIGWLILRPATELIERQFESIVQHRAELEARVIERTKELEAARERQSALVEELGHVGRTSTIGEMASGLAHELNQPLGAIRNYAEGCLIELDSSAPDLEQVKSIIERIIVTNSRVGRIIEQIRKFVTRHAPTREPFDPNAIVEEIVTFLKPLANRNGIDLEWEPAQRMQNVWGDAVQIQQVVCNLVQNAIESLLQSSRDAAKPYVRIWTRCLTDDLIELGVEDNGGGIDPESLAHVFDPYFSTRAGGMGIGLAICRRIVEAHEGQISVSSTTGILTSFVFRIPARTPTDE